MTVWITWGNITERALIVAALEEEGFAARGFESLGELMAVLAQGRSPEVLVLDAAVSDVGRDDWDAIKQLAPATRTVLVSGSMSDTLLADHILRRPISIGELASKIKRITGGTL